MTRGFSSDFACLGIRNAYCIWMIISFPRFENFYSIDLLKMVFVFSILYAHDPHIYFFHSILQYVLFILSYSVYCVMFQFIYFFSKPRFSVSSCFSLLNSFLFDLLKFLIFISNISVLIAEYLSFH